MTEITSAGGPICGRIRQQGDSHLVCLLPPHIEGNHRFWIEWPDTGPPCGAEPPRAAKTRVPCGKDRGHTDRWHSNGLEDWMFERSDRGRW